MNDGKYLPQTLINDELFALVDQHSDTSVFVYLVWHLSPPSTHVESNNRKQIESSPLISSIR